MNISLIRLRPVAPKPDEGLGAPTDGGHRVRVHPRQHRDPVPAPELGHFTQLVIAENGSEIVFVKLTVRWQHLDGPG